MSLSLCVSESVNMTKTFLTQNILKINGQWSCLFAKASFLEQTFVTRLKKASLKITALLSQMYFCNGTACGTKPSFLKIVLVMELPMLQNAVLSENFKFVAWDVVFYRTNTLLKWQNLRDALLDTTYWSCSAQLRCDLSGCINWCTVCLEYRNACSATQWCVRGKSYGKIASGVSSELVLWVCVVRKIVPLDIGKARLMLL